METHIANRFAIRVLKDGGMPYYAKIARAIDSYEIRGLSKAEAKSELAQYLEDIVMRDYREATSNMSFLISELTDTAVFDLDYKAIAEDFLSDYSPRKSYATRNPPTPSAKPKASSNKKPVQKKAAPKKANPTRRR